MISAPAQSFMPRCSFALLALLTFLALPFPKIFAQSSPHITGVDPASGKTGDTITVTGENLGKSAVSAVFLSDDKSDYKAAIVEQGADKIVMKVPQVKSGDYNVSIEVGEGAKAAIYIQPVRFTVE